MSTRAQSDAKIRRRKQPHHKSSLSIKGRELLQRQLAFGVERRYNFYKDMSTFVGEGKTPREILARMEQVAISRKGLKWMRPMVGSILAAMKDGHSLAVSMAPFMPSNESAVLRAAEAGDLQAGFEALAELLKKQIEIRTAVMKVLVMMAGYGSLLIAMVLYFSLTVMPEGRKILTEETFETLVLAPIYYAWMDSFLAWGWLGGFICAGLLAGLFWAFPNWRPTKLRKDFDSLPLVSNYRRQQSAFMLIGLAALMRSGSSFANAINTLKPGSTPWLMGHLNAMYEKQQVGSSEAAALLVGVLPEDIEDRLAIYSSGSDISRIIEVLARDSMEIVVLRMKNLGLVMSLLTMFAVAAFIGTSFGTIMEVGMAARKQAQDASMSY